MRLFYALLFTPESNQRLARVRDALGDAVKSGHFVPDRNLHLTLAFLGDAPGHAVHPLSDLLDGLPPAPPELDPGGFDVFRGKRGHTLHLRIGATATLRTLAAKLEEGLAEMDMAPARRTFRPHVTLARRVRLPADTLLPQAPVETLSVRSVALLHSHLDDEGARYDILSERLVPDRSEEAEKD